jgi:hypothetical protein
MTCFLEEDADDDVYNNGIDLLDDLEDGLNAMAVANHAVGVVQPMMPALPIVRGTNNGSPLASRSQVTELLEQSRQTYAAVNDNAAAVNDNAAAMAVMQDTLAAMQDTLAAVFGMVRTLAEGQAPIQVDTAQDSEEHGVWV